MCQYVTALNAIQSAARDNSHQTLYMIEAALHHHKLAQDLREKSRSAELKELSLRQKELDLRRLGLKELRDEHVDDRRCGGVSVAAQVRQVAGGAIGGSTPNVGAAAERIGADGRQEAGRLRPRDARPRTIAADHRSRRREGPLVLVREGSSVDRGAGSPHVHGGIVVARDQAADAGRCPGEADVLR